MFALQYKSYGGPEVLTVDQAPDVHPAAGQVRVQVRAASVNPFDWKLRAGYMAQGKPLERPAYLGLDAAGVVDEVGEGVTDVAVGDDVFGLGSNTDRGVRRSRGLRQEAILGRLGGRGGRGSRGGDRHPGPRPGRGDAPATRC